MAINNYPGVGPQNSDIASAVAAPSAATIAAAVAAPSAATIASAVLSSGNSAGWGNAGETWTLISTQGVTSSATVTWSSLSGYKKYKLSFDGLSAATNRTVNLRINGLQNNYCTQGVFYNGAVSPNQAMGFGTYFTSDGSVTGGSVFRLSGYIIFNEASLGGAKNWNIVMGGNDQSGYAYGWNLVGTYQGLSAAINSIAIVSNNTWGGGNISLYGGN